MFAYEADQRVAEILNTVDRRGPGHSKKIFGNLKGSEKKKMKELLTGSSVIRIYPKP